MKELFLKKQSELQEICNKSHLEVPSEAEMHKIMNLIVSGMSLELYSSLKVLMIFPATDKG